MSVAFVATTLLFLARTACRWCLSPPVLAFLLGYSFTKRFTAAAHFWLGAALMLAPVSAWIAIRGQQILADPADLLPAVVLGGAVLLWVAGFDIIYACQDVDFDVAAGLHSVPARLGVKRAPAAGRRMSPGHDRLAGAVAARLPARLDLRRRHSWPSPRCWPTNTGSCGPTT